MLTEKECQTQILAKIITDRVPKLRGITGPVHDVYFSNTNLLNGDVYLPVTVEYETRTGKARKREIMVKPPFNPFTGEKQ